MISIHDNNRRTLVSRFYDDLLSIFKINGALRSDFMRLSCLDFESLCDAMSDSTLLINVSRSGPCFGGCQSLLGTKLGYFSDERLVSSRSLKCDLRRMRLLKTLVSCNRFPLS